MTAYPEHAQVLVEKFDLTPLACRRRVGAESDPGQVTEDRVFLVPAIAFAKSNFRKAPPSARRPDLHLRKSFLAFGLCGYRLGFDNPVVTLFLEVQRQLFAPGAENFSI